MDKPTRMYDAMWPRSKRSKPYAKAVVAARFEECAQNFHRLWAMVQPTLSESQETLWRDCLGEFLAWGSESGATDQALDYKLRKNKDLHKTVVDVLVEFHENLEQGIQILETEQFKDTTTAVLEVRDETQLHRSSSSLTSDPTSESQIQVSDSSESIGETFEAIADIVASLVNLGPSLAKPYPEDIDGLSSNATDSGESDQADVELAREMFPAASSVLHTRLGHANWRRKLAQKAFRLQSKQSGKVINKKAAKVLKRTARGEGHQDAFNFQRPSLWAAPIATSGKALLSEIETASDTAPSVFSRPFSRINSETSFDTFESSRNPYKNTNHPGASYSSMVANPVTIPKVPIQLENMQKGQRELFTCTLCGFDLEAGGKIKTEEDWKQHVLEDLEPYLCTFDECFSAQEVFAIRDEWYKHELETHRIEKVWACAACEEEYHNKKQAEQHLETHGDEFGDEDIYMMKATLRKTHSVKPLVQSPCPLCMDKIRPSETRDHISRHLEYFALLSIIDDEESSDEESEEIFSQASDNSMSDRGLKLAVINTFLQEQFNINVERGIQPPNCQPGEDDTLDLLKDSSDSDSEEQRASGTIGQPQESSSRMELKRADLNKAGVSRNSQTSNTVGLSLMTSKERHSLPLLRTCSYPRNDEFQGRDGDLAKLYRILSEPGTLCVVSAEGGMGKTALAVEYSWRFERCYHYVLWIQAETLVGSVSTFCQIAIQLGLTSEITDNDTLVRIGREFLEGSHDKRWLMIFDNVNKWEEIDMYLPKKTSGTLGSILITTRDENLNAPSRPVNIFRWKLQSLDTDDGRRLLINSLPDILKPQELSLKDPEYKIAGELARLAGLPLLILYVSGYIKQSGCTLSEFWEYWDEWMSNLNSAGELQQNHDSIFQIALRDLGLDARKVLKIMAFLDSNGIQQDLLVRNDASKPGPAYLRRIRCRVILANLTTQHFVSNISMNAEKDIYTIHRVLQSRLIRSMKSTPLERDEMFNIAYELVRFHIPRPSIKTSDISNWNTFKEYLPHILSLQHAYLDHFSITSRKPFLGLAELFKDGGVLLWQRNIKNDALKLLYSAEQILDEIESDDICLRCEINVTINLLLQHFGIVHRKEIKQRLGMILEYRKKLLDMKAGNEIIPADLRLIIDAHADYANGLLEFNDFVTAEGIYQKCHEQYLDQLQGSDAASIVAFAKLSHHMAYCRMYRRDFVAALDLIQKAVDMVEELGDQQMTLRYRFDQACIVLQSGDTERALFLHREILEQRLGFQGRASYLSFQSQYAYAAVCHHLGRVEEAERWMRAALSKSGERGGQSFWPPAASARAKYHLSEVIKDSNGGSPTNEALELARDAKDSLSTMLPYDPITGVEDEDTQALFDHLQPVFGGRFTGLSLMKYVCRSTTQVP